MGAGKTCGGELTIEIDFGEILRERPLSGQVVVVVVSVLRDYGVMSVCYFGQVWFKSLLESYICGRKNVSSDDDDGKSNQEDQSGLKDRSFE